MPLKAAVMTLFRAITLGNIHMVGTTTNSSQVVIID